MNKCSTILTEKQLDSNKQYFKIFRYLPEILTVVRAFLFFFGGIIEPWAHRFDGVYGRMRLDTYIGALLIWWLIGGAYCVINYFLGKLFMSPILLQMHYLQSINDKLDAKENQ